VPAVNANAERRRRAGGGHAPFPACVNRVPAGRGFVVESLPAEPVLTSRWLERNERDAPAMSAPRCARPGVRLSIRSSWRSIPARPAPASRARS
jgi:hypothetical protein